MPYILTPLQLHGALLSLDAFLRTQHRHAGSAKKGANEEKDTEAGAMGRCGTGRVWTCVRWDDTVRGGCGRVCALAHVCAWRLHIADQARHARTAAAKHIRTAALKMRAPSTWHASECSLHSAPTESMYSGLSTFCSLRLEGWPNQKGWKVGQIKKVYEQLGGGGKKTRSATFLTLKGLLHARSRACCTTCTFNHVCACLISCTRARRTRRRGRGERGGGQGPRKNNALHETHTAACVVRVLQSNHARSRVVWIVVSYRAPDIGERHFAFFVLLSNVCNLNIRRFTNRNILPMFVWQNTPAGK